MIRLLVTLKSQSDLMRKDHVVILYISIVVMRFIHNIPEDNGKSINKICVPVVKENRYDLH